MHSPGSHAITRRSLIGVLSTGAALALAPSLALAQRSTASPRKRTSRSDDGDSWTSPDYGMEVTWEAPWTEGDTAGSADQGFESITLNPEGSNDYLTLATSEIAADFDSAEEYLDHYQKAYDPETLAAVRDATDGVHLLLNQRTDDSLTVLMYYEDTQSGPISELYEHHAETDAETATSTILVCDATIFEGHLKGAQQYVTLNEGSPYTTIALPALVDIVNNAIDGDYGKSESLGSGKGQDEGEDDGKTTKDKKASRSDSEELDAVREHFDTLHDSVAELVELLSVDRFSEEQANRVNGIIGLWIDASEIATDADIPPVFGDIEDAYLTYADNLTAAGTAFVTVLSDSSSKSEKDRAASDFSEAMDAEPDLAATLDDLLSDAGV